MGLQGPTQPCLSQDHAVPSPAGWKSAPYCSPGDTDPSPNSVPFCVLPESVSSPTPAAISVHRSQPRHRYTLRTVLQAQSQPAQQCAAAYSGQPPSEFTSEHRCVLRGVGTEARPGILTSTEHKSLAKTVSGGIIKASRPHPLGNITETLALRGVSELQPAPGLCPWNCERKCMKPTVPWHGTLTAWPWHADPRATVQDQDQG